MAISKKKISTLDLKPGMYVTQLDRPWREADVLFQGFYVNSLEQIEELRNKYRYVYVDIWRDSAPDRPKQDIKEDALDEEFRNLCGHSKRNNVYKDSTSVDKEFVVAQEKYKRAMETVTEMMRDLQAGRTLKLVMINNVVTDLMESILRNPDAFSWLMYLKNKDDYSYTHSVDSCALAITFGRHLGLPRESLISIGTGALLSDVGKVKLPEGLLNKPGRLSPDEFQVMKKHVDFGVDIVMKIKDSSMELISMVRTHHERFDGSGYPLGIRGSDIPLFGRIAGILDCYDAITSDRSYQKAISPHQALRVLYNMRDKAFQETLVELFIQCLGVYPTGSLVEMVSGEVGIVIEQNRARRLRPKIMLILNHHKVPLKSYETLDLDRETAGKSLELAKVLEPGTYGIDPKEYYLRA
ncbi:MAG: HD-GYP domain-containing protein [Sulfuricaulis sp.]|nr:HD-GYP domain-containing protein [Sulfuricaulis sp.]